MSPTPAPEARPARFNRWRLGASLVLVLNAVNLIWMAPRLIAPLGPVLFAIEAAFFVSLLFAVALHWRRRAVPAVAPALPAELPSVDVFVTCYDEPYEIVRKTLEAATEIRYGNKRVHLLDDGASPQLEALCRALGTGYLARTEHRDAKAGNLNHALGKTSAEYVVTLDADQVPHDDILEVLVAAIAPHPTVGAVSSRQNFTNARGDFNHERFFYEIVQPARDADGCAVAVGSAIILRRSALESIGGFASWNVVEDLTTGYMLNCAGHEVRYVDRALATGLAPTDLRNIYKQRGTWATDTLRLVLRQPILDAEQLTWWQRFHYLQLGVSYVVFAFLTPILLAMPVVSLLACWGMVDDSWSALVHLPGVLGTMALFAYLGGGWDAPRMACGLWPTYLRAFLLAMRPEKTAYKVTDKIEAYGGRHVGLVLPQLGLLVLSALAWFFHLQTDGWDSIGLSMGAVVAFNVWWMAPVLHYGLRTRAVRLKHQRAARRPLRVTFVASTAAAALSLATPIFHANTTAATRASELAAAASTGLDGSSAAAGSGGGAAAPAATKIAGANTCQAPVTYRNLFGEILHKDQAVVDAKLLVAFDQLFHGKGRSIYHEVGADEAYILDVRHGDVRSEGMSYGMMIAVQLDRPREFNRLWRWAKKHMYNETGAEKGYFAWRRTPSGATVKGDVEPVLSAPDGEEYFATALIFASKRWGDGKGVLEYSREARELLDFMAHRGEARDAKEAGYVSLFDPEAKQIVFSPAGAEAKFTNPSYHLPAFYEVWACFDTKNATFWREVAATSRAYLAKATHPKTGLAPEYAEFDGRPSKLPEKGDFRYDAWRVAANIMMDHYLFRKDPWQTTYATNLASFFASQGEYGNEYTLDGKKLEIIHSPGLVATNATLAFALPAGKGKPFLQELWDLDVPVGTERYYDGVLYLLSYLHVSGKFQLWY